MRTLIPALLLATLIALPAAAQTEVTHHFYDTPFSGTTTNRCTGEVVTYQGTCRNMVTRYVYDDGSTRGTARSSCHAEGIGSYGNRYILNENFSTRSDNPAFCTPEGPQAYDEIHERALLISQGSDDNYSLRLDFTFLYNACFEEPPTVIVEADQECRG